MQVEPVDAASVDTASVDAASVDAASVDTASVDAASVDAASVDAASIKATVMPCYYNHKKPQRKDDDICGECGAVYGTKKGQKGGSWWGCTQPFVTSGCDQWFCTRKCLIAAKK